MNTLNETILYVDLKKLEENFIFLKNKLNANTKVIGVVKAFAYGHGAISISKILEDLGFNALWVCDFEEGVSLRKAGVKTNIIVANPGFKSYDIIIKYQLDVVIYNQRLLDLYCLKNNKINIHLKFNTGMNRYGFDYGELKLIVAKIQKNPHLNVLSICSHLAASYDRSKKEHTLKQINKFKHRFLGELHDFIDVTIDNQDYGFENINDPEVEGDGILNSRDEDADGDGVIYDLDETPYGLSVCPVYTDCNGIEFGDSQYDCNGICGGESISGDVNLDSFLDISDMQIYASDIISSDWNATSCNDLDMDGEITVSDIALLVNCIENEEDVTRDNQSEPCEFGMSITNPNDTVQFSIGELNLEEGYVDIHILNPDNEVLGYQFIMGNISITSVENLVENYPITPSFSTGNGMVLGVSYEDSLIIKNYDPAPLCRIYYSSIEENACIETIIDVVNQDYENVIALNNTEDCISNVSIDNDIGHSFVMYPNPASNLIDLKLELDHISDINIEISNMLGFLAGVCITSIVVCIYLITRLDD